MFHEMRTKTFDASSDNFRVERPTFSNNFVELLTTLQRFSSKRLLLRNQNMIRWKSLLKKLVTFGKIRQIQARRLQSQNRLKPAVRGSANEITLI